jgi:hypothetical protein
MKSLKVLLVCLVAILIFSTLAYAEVPKMINYQGKITRPSGALVDTTTSMVFSIYADSTGGTALWTETQTAVDVQYGVFSVLLGSVNPIPDSVFDGNVRYLGVKVGEDSEMTPRKAIVSVGYAYKSLTTDSANYSLVSSSSMHSYDSDSLNGYTAEMIFNMSDLRPLNSMDSIDNAVVSVYSTGSFETRRTIIIPSNTLTEYVVVGFNLRAFANSPNYESETNTVTPSARITVNGIPLVIIEGPSAFSQNGLGSAQRIESHGLTGIYKYKIVPQDIDFSVTNTLTLDLKAVSVCPHPNSGYSYNDYWEVWGK